jgi:hypothetical protein
MPQCNYKKIARGGAEAQNFCSQFIGITTSRQVSKEMDYIIV